jgi:hypothetical protein
VADDEEGRLSDLSVATFGSSASERRRPVDDELDGDCGEQETEDPRQEVER